MLTIAAQTANSIHIRVTFDVATRYLVAPIRRLYGGLEAPVPINIT